MRPNIPEKPNRGFFFGGGAGEGSGNAQTFFPYKLVIIILYAILDYRNFHRNALLLDSRVNPHFVGI